MASAALAYAYFETLVRTGSRSRILEEKTRLWSLNNLLKRTGFDQMLYEDFVTVTLNLLTELASLNPAPVAAATLLERFNDVEVSSAIITHFRVGGLWSAAAPDAGLVGVGVR